MIELSRDITLGQYVNNGSALTRMDPRAKLLCAVFLIVLVSFVNTFTGFAVCLFYCIVLQRESRISLGYALRGFKPFLVLLAFIYIMQILFYVSPTPHPKVIWQWGLLNISWEGIRSSTLIMIRVFFLYYLASMLMFTTSLVDLTDGSEVLLSPLERIGLPINNIVMVFVVAFKFVPIFIAEIERLIKAQTARGVRFDKGNFIKRAMKVGPLLVPLFLSGFRRAEALTIAMEARCYGAGRRGWRRSKRREMHFNRADMLVVIGTVVFCVATVIVNFIAPF
jgi:energy-coupling factor transport system permease protein